VGINKGIQREIFVQLVDIAAQFEVVFIPVEDHAADTRVMLDELQQVGAVVRPD
jgi:predicted phage-related endonuclease